MTQQAQISQGQLDQLASLQAPDEARVLSLYLNLDPREFATPPARASAVNSLCDQAAALIEQADLDSEAQKTLREDLQRARDYWQSEDWAEGAHGFALFACEPLRLFHTVKLPDPVDNQVMIGRGPALAPLAQLGAAERWVVLAVEGRRFQLLEGRGEQLVEIDQQEFERLQNIGPGGWAQRRYQEAISAEREGNISEAAQRLYDYARHRDLAYILIGGSEADAQLVENELDQSLAQRVVGRFALDVGVETVDQIAARALPLLEQARAQRAQEAYAAADHRGLRGIEQALPPLYERRVESLLLPEGYQHPGAVCPRCGWVEARQDLRCPVDDQAMENHPNVVELAVTLATVGDAEIMSVGSLGRAAADEDLAVVLRY